MIYTYDADLRMEDNVPYHVARPQDKIGHGNPRECQGCLQYESLVCRCYLKTRRNGGLLDIQ